MKTNIIIVTLFGSIIFNGIFANLIPGGDFDMKALWGTIIFLIGEISVCPSIIIDKLEKLGTK